MRRWHSRRRPTGSQGHLKKVKKTTRSIVRRIKETPKKNIFPPQKKTKKVFWLFRFLLRKDNISLSQWYIKKRKELSNDHDVCWSFNCLQHLNEFFCSVTFVSNHQDWLKFIEKMSLNTLSLRFFILIFKVRERERIKKALCSYLKSFVDIGSPVSSQAINDASSSVYGRCGVLCRCQSLSGCIELDDCEGIAFIQIL